MPPAKLDPLAGEWLNLRQASRIAGCAHNSVLRAAVIGIIRVKLVPGVPPRYNRADVEAFAAKRPPSVPRPGKKKPGPPEGQPQGQAVKKPRGSKTSEVVLKPQAVTGGRGRKDETPPLKESVTPVIQSTIKTRSGQPAAAPLERPRQGQGESEVDQMTSPAAKTETARAGPSANGNGHAVTLDNGPRNPSSWSASIPGSRRS